MTSPLAPEKIDQLTPVLDSLAHLINSQVSLSDQKLFMLLEGVGLETCHEAFEEIRLWSRLLQRVHDSSSDDLRQATIEALMLRGVKQAPAILAVDAVAQKESSPQGGRLFVSVSKLDLGMLRSGQPGVGEFEVRGDLGFVTPGSDHLQVTPTRFGPGSTIIRVEANPQTEGVLWAPITLTTACESVEIRVLAQWSQSIESDSTARRPLIVIAPDGSGTHRSLVEGLTAAEPDALIYLQPGVHHLGEGLQLHQPLELAGENMDTTELVADRGDCVLRWEGQGLFRLRDLTVRWTGKTAANAVSVQSSQVEIKHCRFQGAVSLGDQTEEKCGCGLWLSGNTAGQITGCEFVKNEIGVAVADEASPHLEGNICRDNVIGIKYSGNAHGVFRRNKCVGNEHSGIHLAATSHPVVEENQCIENSWGLLFADQTGGLARGNECARNRCCAIKVIDAAEPDLEANKCVESQWGIMYSGNRGGVARVNTCTGNHLSGIEVTGQARPTLVENVCHQNGTGIQYSGDAAGHSRRNKCSSNESHGIGLLGEARATLEENECMCNDIGIEFSGCSAGSAYKNKCRANNLSGIEVSRQAQPTLEANECSANKWGLSYSGSGGGKALENHCHDNSRDDIYVAPRAQPVGLKSGPI